MHSCVKPLHGFDQFVFDDAFIILLQLTSSNKSKNKNKNRTAKKIVKCLFVIISLHWKTASNVYVSGLQSNNIRFLECQDHYYSICFSMKDPTISLNLVQQIFYFVSFL